jgi:hypothetical protein
LAWFKFKRAGVLIVWADQTVVVSPALNHARCLGFHYGINTADLVADFPGNLK